MTQAGLDIADRGAEDAEWEDAFDDAGIEEMEGDDEGDDSEDGDHRTSDLMLDRMYAEYQERLGGTSQALKREAKRSHVLSLIISPNVGCWGGCILSDIQCGVM